MTLIAIAAGAVAVLSLAHARCAWQSHDRVLLAMIALRIEHRAQRENWQRVERRLDSDLHVWRHTAAVHQAARQAMYDVVASAPDPQPSPAVLLPIRRQQLWPGVLQLCELGEQESKRAATGQPR